MNEIRKHKKKQKNERAHAEMDTCMNKKQQVPEDQQAAKLQFNTQSNKKFSIRHKNISKFRLISHPHRHQITRRKRRWMTHLIQVQGKNQTST